MDEAFLFKKLQERKENHAFRTLYHAENATRPMVDFCSNDYLGIATNELLGSTSGLKSGSTGSRLLTGNYKLIEKTETIIAEFHEAPAALIFNSGYDANVGLFSCVPQKGDTILYDELSHASIRDGIRLSFADSFSFRHNNMDDLIAKLNKAKGNIFVVTESIFSMDGDMAPLKELATLCADRAHLIVDEAHATGVIGENGEGLTQHLRLHTAVFARIHTFGKALGVHGAAVVGSTALKDYLVNFARPFIYSTALPETTVDHILHTYEIFPRMKRERKILDDLIAQFRSSTSHILKTESFTPIQALLVPGNEQARMLAQKLQLNGLDVRPILYPTVPKGKERLRIVLHSFNSKDDLERMCEELKI